MCESTDSRCTTTVTVRGTHLRISGVSGFLCLSFFAAAKKVSAAPHRGNTNRPLTNQEKANAVGQQPPSVTRENISRKDQRRRQPANNHTNQKPRRRQKTLFH